MQRRVHAPVVPLQRNQVEQGQQTTSSTRRRCCGYVPCASRSSQLTINILSITLVYLEAAYATRNRFMCQAVASHLCGRTHRTLAAFPFSYAPVGSSLLGGAAAQNHLMWEGYDISLASDPQSPPPFFFAFRAATPSPSPLSLAYLLPPHPKGETVLDFTSLCLLVSPAEEKAMHACGFPRSARDPRTFRPRVWQSVDRFQKRVGAGR